MVTLGVVAQILIVNNINSVDCFVFDWQFDFKRYKILKFRKHNVGLFFNLLIISVLFVQQRRNAVKTEF